MENEEKTVTKPVKEHAGEKRKAVDEAKMTSSGKFENKKEEITKSKSQMEKEEDEDEEEEEEGDEEDEEEEGDEEDEEEEGDDDEDEEGGDEEEEGDEEDMAPKKKKRRTRDNDGSEGSGDESEPEIKMTEDDLVGVDTTNIIPRSRRRAAVAAMALASEEIAAATGVAPSVAFGAVDNEKDDGESSDEAEF
ncbi:unnamed protein product [Peronospora belbahrii]|uniref:Histone chaperone domain-containing protein n=1 Tax=Peronospora belbahrii TaxID=622444 RepID=A0ABN8DB48_9STRA|nr:unnamed protein product [Peronospora belbahrii]